jgi:hypothetical protein
MNPPFTLQTSIRHIHSWILLVAALISFVILLQPTDVSAQGGAGVSIKPAQIEKTLNPGVVEQHNLSIENLTSSEQTYYIFVRNISGVGDGGVPIFAKSDTERTGYEITDWITLSTSTISIPAGQAKSITFEMAVPDNASPGSHFGGVFVSVEPPEINTIGASIGYQVANIISIRISGDVNESLTIRQLSTNKYLYSSQDVNFDVRIENEGNVLVRPVGMIEIVNMLGESVDTVPFNEEARAVFPATTRDYFGISWAGGGVGFGRYEARLSVVYGDEGAKKTETNTVTFWILPMNIILPALAALVFVLVVVFVGVKLYIRRSLAHLSAGRRLVSRRRRGSSSGTLLLIVVMLTVTALFLIVLLALFA